MRHCTPRGFARLENPSRADHGVPASVQGRVDERASLLREELFRTRAVRIVVDAASSSCLLRRFHDNGTRDGAFRQVQLPAPHLTP